MTGKSPGIRNVYGSLEEGYKSHVARLPLASLSTAFMFQGMKNKGFPTLGCATLCPHIINSRDLRVPTDPTFCFPLSQLRLPEDRQLLSKVHPSRTQVFQFQIPYDYILQLKLRFEEIKWFSYLKITLRACVDSGNKRTLGSQHPFL
jgi:hypothetical protein